MIDLSALMKLICNYGHMNESLKRKPLEAEEEYNKEYAKKMKENGQ